jgi:hypothetical protein
MKMEEHPSQLQIHKQIDELFETFDARKESRKTLLGFSLIYLSGYFTDPPALFHPQLIHALESEDERRVLILGFRGSGKSTFGSMALPLWAALEYPEKYPFIILVADSARQATLNISAIKHELETNQLIKQDYDAPKHLARVIHHEYFEPAYPDFAPRTKWSLQNAFTSGFKLLEPVPQFKATASFGEFFNSLN